MTFSEIFGTTSKIGVLVAGIIAPGKQRFATQPGMELNMPAGRPLKFKDPKLLAEKIGEYFASCWDYKRDMFGNRIVDKDYLKEHPDDRAGSYVMTQNVPYTVSGLAVALNCSRETLLNYEKELGAREDFFGTIKAAKDKIMAWAETALYTAKNPSGAIFNMKNNYGWKDRTEIDLSGKLITMPAVKINGKELKIDIGDPSTGDFSDPGEAAPDPNADQ